jgi:5-hydroxyisourate hydrolase-like protein (transthyretin family)
MSLSDFKRPKIAASCALLVAFTFLFAECKKANPEDVPQGANELVELSTQKITHVSGTVLFPDGMPAGDIIVEVHTFSENLERERESARLTACITDDDGKFSSPHLNAGKYLLRLGTRNFKGVNEMLVPIVVKRFGWPGKRSRLKLKLVLGT